MSGASGLCHLLTKPRWSYFVCDWLGSPVNNIVVWPLRAAPSILKFARLFYYKNRSQVDRLLLFAIVCFLSGLMRVSSLMRVCVRAQSEVLGLRLYVFCRLISGYPGECCSTQCCCVLIWAHQFQKKQTNKTHLTGSCVPRQAMLL